MKESTHQGAIWESEFGADYIQRNVYNIDELYTKLYGINKTQMNHKFLKGIPKDAKILEVGTNIGVPLKHLQEMGFTNLYGIELQPRAIEFAKQYSKDLYIIKGDALDIPFKDDFFDLVYTHGVLIHISPENIQQALKEIQRVSNTYIWGLEYYAKEYTEIPYHGQKNLLWKTDFKQLYLDNFSNLIEIAEKKFKYIDEPHLVDQMFLLKKV